jgi:hypothetical protein
MQMETTGLNRDNDWPRERRINGRKFESIGQKIL